MKRSRLTYENWKTITRRSWTGREISVDGFCGYASLMRIGEVVEPQTWRLDGKTIVVADAGMAWLCLLPRNGGYCITAMLGKTGEIILWYIDMIADQGIDPDGVPWFDDLYLDLVVRPDGYLYVDDRDELDDALQQGAISPAQHQLALETADRLQAGLLRDLPAFEEMTRRCLAQL